MINNTCVKNMQTGGEEALTVVSYNKQGLTWGTIAVIIANPSIAL